MEEATMVDMAAIIDVVKNREPSFSGARLNFHLKKYVTQDLKHVKEM
jgi:hypothetical protein